MGDSSRTMRLKRGHYTRGSSDPSSFLSPCSVESNPSDIYVYRTLGIHRGLGGLSSFAGMPGGLVQMLTRLTGSSVFLPYGIPHSGTGFKPVRNRLGPSIYHGHAWDSSFRTPKLIGSGLEASGSITALRRTNEQAILRILYYVRTRYGTRWLHFGP